MAPAILFLVSTYLIVVTRGSLNCPTVKSNPLQFHLVRHCQRAAADEALALENTSSLQECADLAHALRGLALNYAPGGPKRRLNSFDQKSFGKQGDKEQRIRSRLSVFEQPGQFFNCHVLKCPQNNTFSSMVNDSRFDYYSLYGRPTVVRNYSCIPEVGLFVVYTQPSAYLNASLTCSNSSEFTGSLAHIASEHRTNLLAQWLVEFNIKSQSQAEGNVYLAYVGLVYNSSTSLSPLDFRNAQRESLQCFLYRAWDGGHPRVGGELGNASCVALTPQGTWQTLNCDRELPFICEIHTARSTFAWEQSSSELDIGPNAVFECGNDRV
ncbi:uncharacterized protein LOC6618842 [Drosophila sechellia]|uniref:GM11881 n=1 Tax=Drosophila sechellia TaxID=7238 RepID=B4IH46_DROSE|nr:uncharacterized protein LOC6618842 [Drosophila sechellia]EDW49222.1 GM11881 [Drosophila sechellia]